MRDENLRRLDRRARAALAAATLLTIGSIASGAANEFVARSEPCVNLRPGPSLANAPLRCLPPGRRMTLLESRGDWGRVRLPNQQEGWVALRLLESVVPGVPSSKSVPPEVVAPTSEPEDLASVRESEPSAVVGDDAAETRRTEELEMALEMAETERDELARALVEKTEAWAEAEAAWREEVDDVTELLRAAELFLSESERQRLQLGELTAALRKENEALRERLGAEAPPEPVTEAAPEPSPGTPRIELPEAIGAALPAAPGPRPTPEPSPVEVRAAPAPSAAVPDPGELFELVTAWARAWSEQRVEDYLSFYAETFQPPRGLARSDWEASRRKQVSTVDKMDVKVALRDVRIQGPTRVEVEFLQSLSSGTSSELVVKTLELVPESGVWKIARERSENPR